MLLIALLFFKMVFPEEAMSLQEKLFIASYYYNTEWVCTAQDNGIMLYERWLKINDTLSVRERKGEMVLNCRYEDALRFLSDYKTLELWMQNIATIEILPDSLHENCSLHIVFKLPWPFDNRHVTSKFQVFQTDSQHCTIKLSSSPESTKKQKGLVCISTYETTLNLIALDAQRVKIELNTFSDEPPLMPVRFQDPMIRKNIYRNLSLLKRELAIPQTLEYACYEE